jgi:hypothetical protein
MQPIARGVGARARARASRSARREAHVEHGYVRIVSQTEGAQRALFRPSGGNA